MKELLDKWEEFTKTTYNLNFSTFMAWYKEQESNKPWVPVMGDAYWFITYDGRIACEKWSNRDKDIERLEMKNVYLFITQAEAALERVKAALKNL